MISQNREKWVGLMVTYSLNFRHPDSSVGRALDTRPDFGLISPVVRARVRDAPVLDIRTS